VAGDTKHAMIFLNYSVLQKEGGKMIWGIDGDILMYGNKTIEEILK